MSSGPIDITSSEANARWARYLARLTLWSRKRLGHVIRSTGTSVVMLPLGICIKSTPFTQLAEAHAMMLVRRCTNVPVPKIYAAFVREGRVVIVMERMPGENLARTWQARSELSRKKILDQLRQFVAELRAVERPFETARVANVDGGPIYDQRLPRVSQWGPFQDVYDFHHHLRNGVKGDGSSTQFPGLSDTVAFHDEPGHTTVLTHGDLSSFNIIADGDKVTGIVDWETAGWLPQYWEYTSDWHTSPLNTFWKKEVDKFLHVDHRALKAELIRRQYFGDTT